MSRCVSDIFVYVHDIYADSFLSAYCPCRCLLIKIKKVGGCWQPATRDVRQRNRTSFKLNARGKSEIFFFYHSFSKITPVLQALLCPSSPGCPGLTVLLRAFLWTSSEAATITLLLFCKSFLYNFIYIYPCIYSYIFFCYEFLLWRYWWDILLFASVPVAALGGAASGLWLAPLIPKLKPPAASGAVVAVITLRVTFAGWPALLQFPAPFLVMALFLLVCRAAAGARLLRFIHTQLAQRLA